uniref:Si:dkeyp-80c12.8 n=1 Tax=Cyprinus carpio TaxID=7962 RepID=A0A8C2C524_CYPCA
MVSLIVYLDYYICSNFSNLKLFMKMLRLFYDLALLSSTGMALKCNLCVSKGNGDPCTPSVQTCLSHMTYRTLICVVSTAPPTIRSCISMSTCWSYLLAPEVMAVCCRTDLCN